MDNDEFKAFMREILVRMEAGHQEYGDKSFLKPPLALVEEIKEEVLDVCGWAFILYRRVSKLAEKAAELDAS